MVETARPRKLTVWRTNHELPLWLRRLKVAAYCPVSSKHDEQLGSLENQAAYYESLIANNPHWELVEIFTDQRTARTMRRRTGLQRMLGLCHAHQIDLIITKSIKRFSRNTVDFLEVCNELKTLGVEVYFELENLYLTPIYNFFNKKMPHKAFYCIMNLTKTLQRKVTLYDKLIIQ